MITSLCRTIPDQSRPLIPKHILVTPYNPSLTPPSLLGLKGGIGNSSFSLKTSKEFVKVLNRIWSLEEQHASSLSLVNTLKTELDQSRVRTTELLREKDEEQEKIKATVKSMRDELENEKKLRKHSESLHRKLARELLDTKTSLAGAFEEFDEERKARCLLEDLCDEFAKGIKNFEQEVRYLKHKPDADRINRESPDRLILHLSEAWLDERMQMEQDQPSHDHGKDTIVNRLSLEIQAFLRAKHALDRNESSSNQPTKSSFRKHSLESFHMNEVMSAPHNAKGEGDSTSSDSNCFESRVEQKPKPKTKKKVGSRKSEGRIKSEGGPRGNSNYAFEKSVRSHNVSSEGEKLREGGEVPGSKKKRGHGLKGSTLKSKLLEARVEGQHSHPKASKGSS